MIILRFLQAMRELQHTGKRTRPSISPDLWKNNTERGKRDDFIASLCQSFKMGKNLPVFFGETGLFLQIGYNTFLRKEVMAHAGSPSRKKEAPCEMNRP